MKHEIKVSEKNEGKRLDHVITEWLPGITRSAAQKWIAAGAVQVDHRPVMKNHRVKANELVEILIPELQPMRAVPEDIALSVFYEDAWVIVVNKPKGMVVHPAPGHENHTLVNALLNHCGGSLSGINGVIRPGIVHRIDKDTSGLLMVAKNDTAHLNLAEQIQKHSFRREYEAIVYGNVKVDSGTICAPIARSRKDRKKMAVSMGDKSARDATTHYRVVARYGAFTRLRLQLETGRTHQIRVHMAHIGHPVAGDAVYGPKKVIASLQGQCLHAALIGFVHPHSGLYLEFEAPLPDYFTEFIRKVEK